MDRLAQKAALARRLGISYGRLQTLIDAGTVSIDMLEEKKAKTSNRICANCGSPLIGKQKRFCSKECRRAMDRKTNGERKPKRALRGENGLYCLKCGEPLIGQQTRFCSRECQKYHRQFASIPVPCKICGNPVTGKRLYCSDKCREIGCGARRK